MLLQDRHYYQQQQQKIHNSWWLGKGETTEIPNFDVPSTCVFILW